MPILTSEMFYPVTYSTEVTQKLMMHSSSATEVLSDALGYNKQSRLLGISATVKAAFSKCR